MTERQNSPGWATYLRVSDEDKQSPKRSFSMQRQRIQDQLLVPSELELKREYRDMLTGTSPNRADYQQMLADAQAGRFSHLGLYRADRFGRNAVEGLQAATTLISLGINIRVANMPTLTPEEPDGFFMFLIQMGLAQREVDVLRQRTAHGMEAKMRAGGWPQRAPEGYINKERQVSSNKYERWVEKDPETSRVIREAWDMLLTDNYTLDQICEALAERGYIRSRGLPWAWNDPKNGYRRNARAMLHKIFHNPFFAGWVVSKRFGIKMGEVRGQWKPTVSNTEFEKGIAILHKHDAYKSRNKVHHYLLRGLLFIETNGKHYKMYGSTPRGKTQSYSYYLTQARIEGKKSRIPCQIVDDQVPDIIKSIVIDPEKVGAVKELYQAEIKQVTHDDRDETIAKLKQRLSHLKDEENRLGRLVITNRISNEAYDNLRKEWREKVQRIESSIVELEYEKHIQIDDLDAALHLMTKLRVLYERLVGKERTKLLLILVNQIIVDTQGKIIDIEFNSPFAYLGNLVEDLSTFNIVSRCSSQVSLGAQALKNRSTDNAERFLSSIQFENRKKMEELGMDS